MVRYADIDIFYEEGEQFARHLSPSSTLYAMLAWEPSESHYLLHKAILANPQTKRVATIMSKFFPDTTLNIFPEGEEIGWGLYRLCEGHYYLSIPRWRRLNPEDSTAEWIFTYPVVSSICQWAEHFNFRSLQTLACTSLHNFVVGGNTEFTQLEEGELEILNYKDCDAKSEDSYLLDPLSYHLPHLYSKMQYEGLSVIVGSAGISETDRAAALTLGAYINKETENVFTPDFADIDTWIEELTEEAEPASEGFISKANDRSNNGVMFG